MAVIGERNWGGGGSSVGASTMNSVHELWADIILCRKNKISIKGYTYSVQVIFANACYPVYDFVIMLAEWRYLRVSVCYLYRLILIYCTCYNVRCFCFHRPAVLSKSTSKSYLHDHQNKGYDKASIRQSIVIPYKIHLRPIHTCSTCWEGTLLWSLW